MNGLKDVFLNYFNFLDFIKGVDDLRQESKYMDEESVNEVIDRIDDTICELKHAKNNIYNNLNNEEKSIL